MVSQQIPSGALAFGLGTLVLTNPSPELTALLILVVAINRRIHYYYYHKQAKDWRPTREKEKARVLNCFLCVSNHL